MNSLSWMIYFAGALDSFKCALGFVVFGCFICVVVCGAICLVFDLENDTHKAKRAKAISKIKLAVILVGAALAADIVLPSSKTLYAIAASEFGEEALKTPEASKARQALNAWLDAQIAEKPEK